MFDFEGRWSIFFIFYLYVLPGVYLVFRIAVLPHRPGVVYYHLLLRRETRIPGVAPFSFRIGIWDLFVHRGQKSYTPTAFGKLWTTPGVRCMTLKKIGGGKTKTNGLTALKSRGDSLAVGTYLQRGSAPPPQQGQAPTLSAMDPLHVFILTCQ